MSVESQPYKRDLALFISFPTGVETSVASLHAKSTGYFTFLFRHVSEKRFKKKRIYRKTQLAM